MFVYVFVSSIKNLRVNKLRKELFRYLCEICKFNLDVSFCEITEFRHGLGKIGVRDLLQELDDEQLSVAKANSGHNGSNTASTSAVSSTRVLLIC